MIFNRIFSFLCVLGFLLGTGLGLTACNTNGQIVGMIHQSFEVTPKCGKHVKTFTFNNNSGQEMMINGVAITAGTNPSDEVTRKRNFTILGTVIGSKPMTDEVDDLIIPTGANYGIVVAFQPQSEGAHTIVIDIAYESPKQGVVQMTLTGTSEGEVECSVDLGPAESVDFDGALFFRIERMNAVISNSPMSLSSEDAISGFTPIVVPIILDVVNGRATLPEISAEDKFLLPPSVQLQNNLPESTLVTTVGESTGTYDPETGMIAIDKMEIHLQATNEDGSDAFYADIEENGFVLTTESVPFPVPFSEGGDFLESSQVDVADYINLVDGDPHGLSLKKSGRVTLVGVSILINFGGFRDNIIKVLKGAGGGIIIQISGKICDVETPEECE